MKFRERFNLRKSNRSNVHATASRLVGMVPVALGLIPTLLACGSSMPQSATAERPAAANQWYARAEASFANGDLEDADHSIASALEAAPKDMETRVLGAKIALALLDLPKVLKLTEGVQTTGAHAARGRARWLSGDLEEAADELEAVAHDPAVKDTWARDVARLARRGQGRHPFMMEGGSVAVVDMPRGGSALVVPCELEGQQVLAMIATGTGEVVVDASSRREPSWVNLRFSDRVEVKDVPALPGDLSGISREVGAPIKALLGSNLLRHTHATFDRRGDQFIIRRDESSPPPQASRVPLAYAENGGLLLRASIGQGDAANTPFLMDSSQAYFLSLTDAAWKRAGVDLKTLHNEPALPNAKSGTLAQFRIGGFDLPGVPAVQGMALPDAVASSAIHVGGVMGAGFVSSFRVTMGDDGRFAWLEPDPTLTGTAPPNPNAPPASPIQVGPAQGNAPRAPQLAPPTLTLPGAPSAPGARSPGAKP